MPLASIGIILSVARNIEVESNKIENPEPKVTVVEVDNKNKKESVRFNEQ